MGRNNVSVFRLKQQRSEGKDGRYFNFDTLNTWKLVSSPDSRKTKCTFIFKMLYIRVITIAQNHINRLITRNM